MKSRIWNVPKCHLSKLGMHRETESNLSPALWKTRVILSLERPRSESVCLKFFSLPPFSSSNIFSFTCSFLFCLHPLHISLPTSLLPSFSFPETFIMLIKFICHIEKAVETTGGPEKKKQTHKNEDSTPCFRSCT